MSTCARYIGDLSPNHSREEDQFVTKYCTLWRITGDIVAKWGRIIAPFGMADRLALTKPGHNGDINMLQIGPRDVAFVKIQP